MVWKWVEQRQIDPQQQGEQQAECNFEIELLFAQNFVLFGFSVTGFS
jgi:hypothetical protein